MNIVLKESVCDNYGISMDDALIFLLELRRVDIPKRLEEIKEQYDLPSTGNRVIVSLEIKRIIDRIMLSSRDEVVNNEDFYKDTAKALQELYPKVKKSGTNYYWRGNLSQLADRLKLLKVKYKFDFTKEQAVQATKNYIESFNGDYAYMQLLQYFIFKNTQQGFTSQLMNYIENEGQQDEDNQDIMLELR